jgi:enoyl-CoA hydratase/carnithine racemase
VSAKATLSLETPSEGVALLRLDRPDRLNAINEEMLNELQATFAAIATDRSVRVVVLTGAGRGFCAGVDMRDFGPSMPDVDAPSLEKLRYQETMAALPQALRSLPQPVVAAVNGPAVGGGMALCLASDLRICSASATFGNAAILIGLTGAEMGMSYLLPRVVGLSVAADWMLTGRTIAAEEACHRGLVSELVDDDRLHERALEIAVQIAGHSALGAQLTKRALQVNTDAPDLAAAVELENRNQLIAADSEEAAAARQRWAGR